MTNWVDNGAIYCNRNIRWRTSFRDTIVALFGHIEFEGLCDIQKALPNAALQYEESVRIEL